MSLRATALIGRTSAEFTGWPLPPGIRGHAAYDLLPDGQVVESAHRRQVLPADEARADAYVDAQATRAARDRRWRPCAAEERQWDYRRVWVPRCLRREEWTGRFQWVGGYYRDERRQQCCGDPRCRPCLYLGGAWIAVGK